MADMTAGLGGKYLKSKTDIGMDDMPVGTISEVKLEKMGDGDMCFVAYFSENLATGGTNKGMVLNKSNLQKVIDLAGSTDTDDAVGVRVMIYAVETQKPDGSPTTGLRLRAAPARSQTAQTAVDNVTEAFDMGQEPGERF